MSEMLSSAIKDIQFAYLSADSNKECPKISFTGESQLGYLASTLTTGFIADSVTVDNAESLVEHMETILNDETLGDQFDELTSFAVQLAANLGSAMSILSEVVTPEVNKLTEDITTRYKNMLIRDGNEMLLTEEVEPDTSFIKVCKWEVIESANMRDILFDKLYDLFNISVREVSTTGRSIMTARCERMFDYTKISNLTEDVVDVLIAQAMEHFKDAEFISQADIKLIFTAITNPENFKKFVHQAVELMRATANEIPTGSRIPNLIYTANLIKAIECIKDMSFNDISDETVAGINTAVSYLETLKAIIMYSLQLDRESAFDGILIMDADLINGDQVKALEDAGKTFVDVVKYIRAFTIGSFGVRTDVVLSADMQAKLDEYNKSMAVKSESIRRTTINAVFHHGIGDAAEEIAIACNTEYTSDFKTRLLTSADEIRYQLKGDICNLDGVLFDLIMRVGYSNTLEYEIYNRFSKSYRNINTTANTEVGADDIALIEVKALTEILVGFLVRNYCSVEE